MGGLFVAAWRRANYCRRKWHRSLQQRTSMTFIYLCKSSLARVVLIEWWRLARRARTDKHIYLAQVEAEKALALARDRHLDDPELFKLGKSLQTLRDSGAPV